MEDQQMICENAWRCHADCKTNRKKKHLVQYDCITASIFPNVGCPYPASTCIPYVEPKEKLMNYEAGNKPLTVAEMIKAIPHCADFEDFCFHLTITEPNPYASHPLECILNRASQYTGGVSTLVRHGFLKEKKAKPYRYGQKIKLSNSEIIYILAYVNSTPKGNFMCFVALDNGGRLSNHPIAVKDPDAITEDELLQLLGGIRLSDIEFL